MAYDQISSTDQYEPRMISEYDTEPWPGLWDTTRADVFRMAAFPCFKCDGNFKGAPREQQFAPSCASYNPQVIAEVSAKYPEIREQCMSCGRASADQFKNNGQPQQFRVNRNPGIPSQQFTNNRNPGIPPQQSFTVANCQQPENYSTDGPDCNSPTGCISQCGRKQFCSCMGQVGCQKLPEGSQAGNEAMNRQPLTVQRTEGFTSGINVELYELLFQILIFIIIIVCLCRIDRKLNAVCEKMEISIK